MKAILLAAGRGTRISKQIGEIPKCTVDIGNNLTLINYTVKLLQKNGITDITIITGYKKEAIENTLIGENVNLVYNPFYAITNSIASLWFAKEKLNDDVIMMNADVFIDEVILKKLLDNNENVVMLSDVSRADSGDFFFYVNENNCIKNYGKELSREERNCEYVGLAKISSNFIEIFKNKLDEMIKNGEFSVWWENVLYSMLNTYDIKSLDVSGFFWAEADYYEDYLKIKNHYQNIKQ